MEFSEWLTEQSEDVQEMINGHISGLSSALETERKDRKSLQKQVKDLASKAESGSEIQKQLDQMTADLNASNGRSFFYESVSGQGVKNLKLAHLAAAEAGLIGDDGTVDLDGLKKGYPELFGTADVPMVPRGNAGEGAGSGGSVSKQKISMDDLIRSSVGI